MNQLLIIALPFTSTVSPSLAPALLKACAESQGVTATAWDLSAEFNNKYSKHENYFPVIAWLQDEQLKPYEHQLSWYKSVVEEYADRIVNFYKPKVVALSLLTISSMRFAEDLSYALRLKNSDITIIIGGSPVDTYRFQFNKLWCEIIVESKLADAVLVGEGEYAIAEIVKNNLKGIIRQPQMTNQQFDQVPFPDYSDYDFTVYDRKKKKYWSKEVHTDPVPILLITSSKGCVKSCTFCDVGRIWNKFRYRNGLKVAEEIIHLHKTYGATVFSFTDSLMNGGMKPFYEMNKTLSSKLPSTVKYDGQMICRGKKDMPEFHFEQMQQAGCYAVTIGIESGSERVRNDMGKGSSQEDIHYSTEMLIKYKIKQGWNIIAGYPTETQSDWDETMQLIKYWLPRSNGLLRIHPVGTMSLLDGTPITETDLYHHLELESINLSGYSQFAWTSRKNPNNTFETRAANFLELCNYLIDYNPEEYEQGLKPQMDLTQRRLELYYEHNKL